MKEVLGERWLLASSRQAHILFSLGRFRASGLALFFVVITRTPYRISFFGGGSDYPEWYLQHGGRTLFTTINRYLYVSVRRLPPFFDHKTRVVWSKIEMVKSNAEIEHPAVAAALRHLKVNDGLEIHYDGDLPARSGTGSSSSFMVGLLHAIYILRGVRNLDPLLLARVAIMLEREIMQETVGVQDQVAASFGGLNLLEIDSSGAFHVEHFGGGLPRWYREQRMRELQGRLMLLYTGVSRNASDVAHEQTRRMDDSSAVRRLQQQAEWGWKILEGSGPIDDFGELLHDAWMAKKTLAAAVSNSYLDGLYDEFRRAGIIGGKLTGAGGGGFFLLFGPDGAKQQIRKQFPGLIEVPFKFDQEGSRVILGA